MSLSSAIKMARLLSLADIQTILEAALRELSSEAKENCALYDDQHQQGFCPGEGSCSVEDVLLAVATATFDHFNVTVSEEFEDINVYAVQ